MSGIQFLYCLFRSCFFFNPSILDPDNNYQLSAVSFQQKNQKKIATTAQGGLTMTDHKLEHASLFLGSFFPSVPVFFTLLLWHYGTLALAVPLLLLTLQHRDEGALGDGDGAYHFHPLFPLFLFLQELSLACDVTAVAFCRDILSEG